MLYGSPKSLLHLPKLLILLSNLLLLKTEAYMHNALKSWDAFLGSLMRYVRVVYISLFFIISKGKTDPKSALNSNV